MATRELAVNLLRRALGDPSADLRIGQWEAIDALVNRRQHLLVVERTGWGKSTVYFIATRMLRDTGAGPTLIVSPLLALMRNQIDSAERLGIRAASINSTNPSEWPEIVGDIESDAIDTLLISPERLANDRFVDEVLLPIGNRLGMIVVDEAHCISDWGHDFRPDYRRLTNVLRRVPSQMPILGTTATANDRVIEDVRSQLGNFKVQRGSLHRRSLALQTMRLPDQIARLAWLSEYLPDLPGTGIVYVLTKRDADQVTGWLRQNGIEAHAYYSGVVVDGFDNSEASRLHLEDLLLRNQLKALVATTALGMGYDKPDLGFVIHYQAPGSIIAYYQQVGRAGRAVDHAVGLLMAGAEDDEIHEYFRNSAFPGEGDIHDILDILAANDGLTARQLEARVNLRYGQINHVLKYLSVENPSPVIRDRSRWRRTAVAWQLDRSKIAHLTSQRRTEWNAVQDYVETDGCLMLHLTRALDDPNPDPCGRCSNCVGSAIVPETPSRERSIGAARFLKQAEFPLVCRTQVAAHAFDEYEFKGNLPAHLRAEEGRALARWRDAGWGGVVADDKHAGEFRHDLVEALAEMINERWKPDPRPTWVTSVPSQRHPDLVPSFARKLAHRLGLPCVPAVAKVRDNEPQKHQANRYRQCRNLDGAFSVSNDVSDGPVFLIDDVVDSTWTMTVVSALLREAGCGPVFPVALASASPGA